MQMNAKILVARSIGIYEDGFDPQSGPWQYKALFDLQRFKQIIIKTQMYFVFIYYFIIIF